MNSNEPQVSPLVDLKDPVQIHLLTETALLDSKGYHILSQEEVDDVKKQIMSLEMRIEQARANLAIQTKYRDAAISMAKLYSPSKPDSNRRLSFRGNRFSDSAKEAEMERLASERRCEELAAELFSLEKSLMVPQRRLLEHTAGILQMTHRASIKKSSQPPPGQPLPNGIPGSPESLYTYTNARNSLDVPNDESEFGDRSLYLALDQVDGQSSRPRKNPLEIPMKSPIREQNSQLREEMDKIKQDNVRIKEENGRVLEENSKIKQENVRFQEENSRFRDENQRLRAVEQNLSDEAVSLRTQSTGPMQIISDTERKLEELNSRLRDVIISFGPARSIDFGNPERATGSGGSIENQLKYLSRGIDAAAEEHESYSAGLAKESEMAAVTVQAAAAAEAALMQAKGRVEGLILQFQGAFQRFNSSQQLPPEPVTGTLDNQLDYLKKVIRIVGDEMAEAAEALVAASSRKNDDQSETVLSGLWDIIQSGLAEAQQQKAVRRKARADKGLEPDEDDMSDGETVNPDEPYTLSAFSTKVQWLFQQATSLREQKGVLKRQIKQQRELNNKSDSEKDQTIRDKEEEIEKLRNILDDSEQATIEMQEKLAKALGDFERLQKSNAANDSASAKALQDQLKERTASLAALEASYQEVESSYQEVQSQLRAAEARAAALQKDVANKEKEAEDKDEELDRMNVMVIELKTEVAFAKAELDGAYGSRRERAAEAAALAQSSELDEKNKEVARLKTELASTLRDFEDITRESITAEKEKLELEGKLDDAVAAKASFEAEMKSVRDRLEAEVNRLQEQLDAERLKVPPSPALAGGAGPRAGAAMLSEQFRATMKEERKKFQEELRVSCS